RRASGTGESSNFRSGHGRRRRPRPSSCRPRRPAQAPAAPATPAPPKTRATPAQFTENTKTLLPRLKSSWVLPPHPIAMYWRLPTMYETGMAFAPAPQLKLHSFLPVAESRALKLPLPSPKKNRPPPVVRPPPISGCSVSCFHATLPVSTLTAETRPHCFSPGITLKAPPSHSLEPPG